jgi:hypothetical protein
MLFDIDLDNQRLIETAPCPPPWQMSLIFSSTICLDCKQRIDVLYRCLKEWNTKIFYGMIYKIQKNENKIIIFNQLI